MKHTVYKEIIAWVFVDEFGCAQTRVLSYMMYTTDKIMFFIQNITNIHTSITRDACRRFFFAS